MHRTTIMLPTQLRLRILKKAGSIHASLGEFLRIAAEGYLNREERKWTEDPLLTGNHVIEASTPAHVSENVDAYLCGRKR